MDGDAYNFRASLDLTQTPTSDRAESNHLIVLSAILAVVPTAPPSWPRCHHADFSSSVRRACNRSVTPFGSLSGWIVLAADGELVGARLASIVRMALSHRVVHHRHCRYTNYVAGRTEASSFVAALVVPSAPGRGRRQRGSAAQGSTIGAWTDFMLGFSIGPLLGGALAATTHARADLLAERAVYVGRHCRYGLAGSVTMRGRWHAGRRADLGRLHIADHVHGCAGVRTAWSTARGSRTTCRCRCVLAGGGRVRLVACRGSACPCAAGRLELLHAAESALGVAIGSLSMFGIMSLLLYFNLYARARKAPVSPRCRRSPRCCR